MLLSRSENGPLYKVKWHAASTHATASVRCGLFRVDDGSRHGNPPIVEARKASIDADHATAPGAADLPAIAIVEKLAKLTGWIAHSFQRRCERRGTALKVALQ